MTDESFQDFEVTQSRTGGVFLCCAFSARMIFYRANSGMQKSWQPLFSSTATINAMHKTLYNISRRGGGKCPQNISFFPKGAPVYNGTMASLSLTPLYGLDRPLEMPTLVTHWQVCRDFGYSIWFLCGYERT